MRTILFSLIIILLVAGCKTAPINQKINKKKEGLWIENYGVDSTEYKSIGKYQNDEPIKKWKYYLEGKIIKKENYKFKSEICKIKNYYKTGKIQSKGKTRIVTDSIETHWFYFGDWKYYDEKGKLITIRKYEDGNLISEKEIIKK